MDYTTNIKLGFLINNNNDITITDETDYLINIDGADYSYCKGNNRPFISYALIQRNYDNTENYIGELNHTINIVNTFTSYYQLYKAIAVVNYSDIPNESHIFNDGDLCYYAGDLYYNSSGVVIDSSSNPFDSGKWTIITDVDYIVDHGIGYNDFAISNKISKAFIYLNRVDDNQLKYNFNVNVINASFNYVKIENSNYTSSNDTHIFSSEGEFNIIVNYTDIDNNIKNEVVTILVIKKISSSFNYSINNNGEVIFEDTSCGDATFWLWDFGDGDTSSIQNPVHRYQNKDDNKNYNVSLEIQKQINGVTYNDFITKTITVPPTLLDKLVTINNTRINDNDLIYKFKAANNFHSTEWNITIDSENYSSLIDTLPIVHIFSSEGNKNIEVSYIDDEGNSITFSNTIFVIKQLHANFSYNGTTNQIIFTNKSKGDETSWLWDFGDGETSNYENPTHIYPSNSSNQFYTVSLTIKKTINGIEYENTYEEVITVIGTLDCSLLYDAEYYTSKCHNFISSEQSNVSKNRKLYIYKYDGTLIKTYKISSGENKINYSIEKDGVYIIKIYTIDEEGNNEDLLKEFPLYSYCDSEKCYEDLFNKIFCCDNYCNDDCLDKSIIKMRRALTRIVALFGFIKKYVFLERNKYLGTIVIDNKRMDYIYKVVQYSDILENTITRCNSCFSDKEIESICSECKK